MAALCALGLVWLNIVSYQRTSATINRIQQAHALRSSINILMRHLTEAESLQRGFVLTADAGYMQPYRDSLRALDLQMRELDRLAPLVLGSEPEALDDFRHLLSRKIGEMSLATRLSEQNRPEAVNFVMSSKDSLAQNATIKLHADALQQQAVATIAGERVELYRLLNVSLFGMAAGVAAAYLLFYLYFNQTRALRRADSEQQQLLEKERDALESQVKERTFRLRELATYLQQAVEEERAHLARELHDELGALLTAAKLNVARIKSKLPPDSDGQLAERLQHLTETLNQGIALKRRIIEDLRPSSLANLGLVASLEILTREFSERAAIDVQAILEPVELDANTELTIYRTVQEALTNIGKYAQASQVKVVVQNYVNHAEVEITDNGVGFDPAQLPHASHGLIGMRHRIEASGGKLEILSSPQAGTRITATIPRGASKDQSALATSVGATSAESYRGAPLEPTV